MRLLGSMSYSAIYDFISLWVYKTTGKFAPGVYGRPCIFNFTRRIDLRQRVTQNYAAAIVSDGKVEMGIGRRIIVR